MSLARIDGGTEAPGLFTERVFNGLYNHYSAPSSDASAPSEVTLSDSTDAKVTVRQTYVPASGEDTSKLYDCWIDNGDGTWTYRFHVYEEYTIDENGQLYDDEGRKVYDAQTTGSTDDEAVDNPVKITFNNGDSSREPVYDADSKLYVIHSDLYDIIGGKLYYKGTTDPVCRKNSATQITLASYNVTEVTQMDGISYLTPYEPTYPTGEYYRNLVYLVSEDPEFHNRSNATVKNIKRDIQPSYGTLSLTKIVDGEAPNSDESFNFTVTIGRVVQSPVSLKAGESKFWTVEIPEGQEIDWSIEENLTDAQKKQYAPSLSQTDGKFTANGQQVLVTATNKVLPTKGELSITKTVDWGEFEQDADAAFSFRVELYTEEGESTTPVTGQFTSNFGVISFGADGVSATPISLKAGETITIKDLPIGAKYEVREVDIDDLYRLTAINGAAVAENAEDPKAVGEIAQAVSNKTFTNEKTGNEPRGGFTLQKRMGVNTETEEYFTFKVDFTNLKPKRSYYYRVRLTEAVEVTGGTEVVEATWSEPYAFTADTNGRATIPSLKLKANQLADFTAEYTKLPAGGAFAITEQASGYTASYVINNTSDGQTVRVSGANTTINQTLATRVETLAEGKFSEVVFTNTEPVYTISIGKFDEHEARLGGAQLELYSITVTETTDPESQEVIQTYTRGDLVRAFESSADEATSIAIQPGEYILTEAEAPEGYQLTHDVYIRMTEAGRMTAYSVRRGTLVRVIDDDSAVSIDGQVKEIEMVDKPYEIRVLKVDESGQPLAGAVLAILRNGNPVTNPWNTTTVPKVISGVIQKDTEYILHEISAPGGYDVAEDIRFRLVDDPASESSVKLETWKGNDAEASSIDGDQLQLVMRDASKFTFIKLWRDAVDQNTVEWPENKAITVHLNRYYGDNGVTMDESFEQSYTIAKCGDGFTITSGGSDYVGIISYDSAHEGTYSYQFKLLNLPMQETVGGETRHYSYFVSEEQVDAYQPPKYFSGHDERQNNIPNGGEIHNCIVSVVLPSTGGPGTTLFIVSGITLVLLAIALLLRKKEQY